MVEPQEITCYEVAVMSRCFPTMHDCALSLLLHISILLLRMFCKTAHCQTVIRVSYLQLRARNRGHDLFHFLSNLRNTLHYCYKRLNISLCKNTALLPIRIN